MSSFSNRYKSQNNDSISDTDSYSSPPNIDSSSDYSTVYRTKNRMAAHFASNYTQNQNKIDGGNETKHDSQKTTYKTAHHKNPIISRLSAALAAPLKSPQPQNLDEEENFLNYEDQPKTNYLSSGLRKTNERKIEKNQNNVLEESKSKSSLANGKIGKMSSSSKSQLKLNLNEEDYDEGEVGYVTQQLKIIQETQDSLLFSLRNDVELVQTENLLLKQNNQKLQTQVSHLNQLVSDLTFDLRAMRDIIRSKQAVGIALPLMDKNDNKPAVVIEDFPVNCTTIQQNSPSYPIPINTSQELSAEKSNSSTKISTPSHHPSNVRKNGRRERVRTNTNGSSRRRNSPSLKNSTRNSGKKSIYREESETTGCFSFLKSKKGKQFNGNSSIDLN